MHFSHHGNVHIHLSEVLCKGQSWCTGFSFSS